MRSFSRLPEPTLDESLSFREADEPCLTPDAGESLDQGVDLPKIRHSVKSTANRTAVRSTLFVPNLVLMLSCCGEDLDSADFEEELGFQPLRRTISYSMTASSPVSTISMKRCIHRRFASRLLAARVCSECCSACYLAPSSHKDSWLLVASDDQSCSSGVPAGSDSALFLICQNTQ